MLSSQSLELVHVSRPASDHQAPPTVPVKGTSQLAAAAASRWMPDAKLRAGWISQLERANRNLLDRLISVCSSPAGESAHSPRAA